MSTLRKLIEQRIASQTSAFKEVAGAASMEAILGGRIEAPGCYVFRERATAGQNQLINSVSQNTLQSIAVVVVSRNVKTATGSDSSDDNELLCDAVRSALLGYSPSQIYSPLEYAGGALVSFTNGLLIWREAYRSNYLISK